jgi:hypothetical protein
MEFDDYLRAYKRIMDESPNQHVVQGLKTAYALLKLNNVDEVPDQQLQREFSIMDVGRFVGRNEELVEMTRETVRQGQVFGLQGPLNLLE